MQRFTGGVNSRGYAPMFTLSPKTAAGGRRQALASNPPKRYDSLIMGG